jgi:hypothetical protein
VSTHEALDYLHDAEIREIRFEIVGGCRRYVLRVTCHADAGSPTWDGRTLLITLEDVRLASHSVFGAVTAAEIIDSWKREVSPAMRGEVKRLEDTGLRIGDEPFAITFHSGSHLEGVCGSVRVTEAE